MLSFFFFQLYIFFKPQQRRASFLLGCSGSCWISIMWQNQGQHENNNNKEELKNTKRRETQGRSVSGVQSKKINSSKAEILASEIFLIKP